MSKYLKLKNEVMLKIGERIQEKLEGIEKDHDQLSIYATNRQWEKFKEGTLSYEEMLSKATKKIAKYSNDIWKDNLDLIEQAEKNTAKVKSISIVVEWKRNRTWGNNPTATATIVDSDGHHYYTGTASGCGYDKESAAIAGALNQSVSLRCMLMDIKENNMDKRNHDLLGYGSGYNTIPAFEGGVGVRSLMDILRRLGAEISENHSGKTTDFYQINFPVS